MEATKKPNSSDGALSATRSLIQDGRWRPIEEADKDCGSGYILKLQDARERYGYYHISPDHASGDGWFDPDEFSLCHPTHFRPLPDNRLADALEVAVERISLAISYADDGVPLSARRVIEEALAKIEQIAKGEGE